MVRLSSIFVKKSYVISSTILLNRLFVFFYRRLVVHPKGIWVANYLCLYLRVADPKSLPFGWRRHVKYSLTIVNQTADKNSLRRGDCFFPLSPYKISCLISCAVIFLN